MISVGTYAKTLKKIMNRAHDTLQYLTILTAKWDARQAAWPFWVATNVILSQ